jgi:hypothetical protein
MVFLSLKASFQTTNIPGCHLPQLAAPASFSESESERVGPEWRLVKESPLFYWAFRPVFTMTAKTRQNRPFGLINSHRGFVKNGLEVVRNPCFATH